MLPGQINTLDPRSLGDLKRLAHSDSKGALQGAAQQFEALFLQMTLKAMRDATPSTGYMENDQTRMYQSMLDQQLATDLAQKGGAGLAAALVRQLGGSQTAAQTPASTAGTTPLVDGLPGSADVAPGTEDVGSGDPTRDLAARMWVPSRADTTRLVPEIPLAARHLAAPGASRTEAAALAAPAVDQAASAAPAAVAAGSRRAAAAGDSSPSGFVNRVWDEAQAAAEKTGIPARFMVAQAALETGWGRQQLRRTDGSPSYNVFNIKAGPGWKGDTVTVQTREYDASGKPYMETARFRAYGSYEEAFRDYANLIAGSPRYAKLVGETDANRFARGLQQAGYATDPAYATKLARIIDGSTLRGALSG